MASLTLPYPPSANRYWRNFRGRMVPSADAARYKRLAASLAAGLVAIPDAPVSVTVVLRPHQPKKPTGKPTRCIDLDNALKVALDALQGVAYANDRQIAEIHARRGEPVPGGSLTIEWEEICC